MIVIIFYVIFESWLKLYLLWLEVIFFNLIRNRFKIYHYFISSSFKHDLKIVKITNIYSICTNKILLRSIDHLFRGILLILPILLPHQSNLSLTHSFNIKLLALIYHWGLLAQIYLTWSNIFVGLIRKDLIIVLLSIVFSIRERELSTILL